MRAQMALVLVLVGLAAACSEQGESAPAYASAGQHAVGVTTLMVDGSPCEVWYPADLAAVEGKPRARYDMRDWLPADARAKIPDADAPMFEMAATRDVPAAAGRFPLVLFSHGLAGYRMQSSFLMTHLASWGFVVAAPEHPERGLRIILEKQTIEGDRGAEQLRAALAALREETGLVAGHVDFTRVAVSGHSMGGAAARAVAGDEGITTWMVFASGAFGGDGAPMLPSFIMAGTGDELANSGDLERGYLAQPPRKRYLAIRDAGHLAFSDICAIGRERGGVLKIAEDHQLVVPDLVKLLGNDGCRPEDLPVEQAWPIVRHFSVAHLRHAFGIDESPIDLDDEVVPAFGDRIFRYLHDE